MTDNIGATLGKYDILEELGRGGFGAVYRVRNRDLDREEALKVLGRHRLWDPTFVRRFQREARAAARLRHPHIVTIYEVGEVDGSHFLSMEYLPGQTLARLIATEGALPLVRASALISQVADALDYAHAQGLVHRDVKPSNIMVGPGDRVTLTDFGLVKAADHSEMTQEMLSSGAGLTTAAAAMGTPEYMAPELAEPNGAFDYRADIYSLAVVGYQALTGQLPFSAPTPVAVLRAQVDLPPPPLTQWAPGLPEPVCAAVLRGLAKNPRDRHPSAGGFAAALADSARQADAVRARDEKLAGLYASAEEALAAKNWAAALAACGQVMTLNPGYRDVGALFDQANAGLARQREWEAQQEEMAGQYDAAQAALATGDWAAAIRLLTPLASGDQVFRDADRRLAEAAAAQAAEDAHRKAQVEGLYQKALAAYETVRARIAEILALDPEWRDPTGALDRVMDAPPEPVDRAAALPEPAPEPATSLTGWPARLKQFGPWRIVAAGSAALALLLLIWVVALLSLPPAEKVVVELVTATPAVVEKVVEKVVTQVVEHEVTRVAQVVVTPTAEPATATPLPERKAGATRIAPTDGMDQVYVPVGSFFMGGTRPDSQPVHEVTLNGFWIDRTEVTHGQYAACVAAGVCAKPSQCQVNSTDDGPVVCVTWQAAADYCAWAGRRLPTEAEWEKAARGTDRREFPWGSASVNGILANNSRVGTKPVGSYPAGVSPYGALDMVGNAEEWVADWYSVTYYTDSPAVNPAGPATGTYKVVRGGGWNSIWYRLSPSFRVPQIPDSGSKSLGFRCAQDAE